MICKKCGREHGRNAKQCPGCGAPIIINMLDISAWGGVCAINLSDCCVRNMPSDLKNEIRQNFVTDNPDLNIGIDEEILFVRDTSFWNTRDQGLVMTDEYFYCIPDNEKKDNYLIIGWNQIKTVEYKDMVMNFILKDGVSRQIHISNFIKDTSKASQIGQGLAQHLTQIAQAIPEEEDPVDVVIEKFDSLVAEGKHEEAMQLSLSYARQEGFELCYITAAQSAITLKKLEQTIEICDEGINRCEQGSFIETYLYYEKYSAQQHLGRTIGERRKNCLPVVINATDDMKMGNLSIKEDAKNDFEFYDKEYVTSYLELPYRERKVLVPVREYTDLMQNHLTVIDIHKINDTGINFPMGHPIAYQLYVGHPYIPNKYIPFENHELELVEDKIREFCQIAQHLGAKEISIECLNSSSNESNRTNNQNASGEINYKFTSAKGSAHGNASRHLIDEISQSINLHQVFTPRVQPALPDNLVWYHNEPSWQRLYEQRMQGSLLQHEERIETRKSRVFEGTELNSIKGEFECVIVSGNGSWEKSMDEKFTLQENAVLAIQVTFASLEELNGSSSVPVTTSLLAGEQEYVDELKACLEEDGVITSGERRLLDKLRKRLGISTERALHLEESLTPQLTEEEKEYLEDVRSCVEEDGRDISQISNSERRLLEKSRIRLNISEERARELENNL